MDYILSLKIKMRTITIVHQDLRGIKDIWRSKIMNFRIEKVKIEIM